MDEKKIKWFIWGTIGFFVVLGGGLVALILAVPWEGKGGDAE